MTNRKELIALIEELDSDMAHHAERISKGSVSGVPFVATERVLPLLRDFDDRLRDAMALIDDLVELATAAMLDANRDGAGFEIEANLTEAIAFLAIHKEAQS